MTYSFAAAADKPQEEAATGDTSGGALGTPNVPLKFRHLAEGSLRLGAEDNAGEAAGPALVSGEVLVE